MKQSETVDEVISNLSGHSFDLAINEPENYANKLLKLEAEAKTQLAALITEIVESALPEKQDEHPTEDGVPVETYGYEAEFNKAIDQTKANLPAILERYGLSLKEPEKQP